MLSRVDGVSLFFALFGSIIVYVAKYILKFFKIREDDFKLIIIKLIGLVIACIGFFRILKIF
ncbi:hypothetical protein SAMN05443428_109102 [Caloramator quimbayensis]|uniref:Uncharacterized protein n=1 Tax=Caloramator quimbayensis TaxID=1147123 RepID=A0A1T4XI90_9CLOT|nr:hypothetical protein [Caloramator quimbayensis]SKA89270.1 hypothetical protein SAMN05443428_109102 [Caloramator quimbayensis]